MKWFVEDDGEMSVLELDLREGGRYRLKGTVQQRPWTILGTYLEVRPPEKLVYTWTWENDPLLGEPQGDTLVTVEFHERGAETEIILTHERFVNDKARAEHDAGWIGCLDRLSAIVEEGGTQ